MPRRTNKTEKTFELSSAGRPPRLIKESQLRAQLSSFAKNSAWQEILQICSQLGDKRYNSSWIGNHFLKAIEATSQHQALLTESAIFLDQQPRNPTILSWRAHALRLNGRVEESIDVLRRAIKVAKPDAALFNALGSALKESGQLEEASSWFDRALAMQPDLAKAHWNRSDLVQDHESAIDLIEKTLVSSRGEIADRDLLHFSLYRHYENFGYLKKAFEHLETGNQLKRAQVKYDSSQASELTNKVIEFFDKDFDFSAPANPEQTRPIFVFGLPRSGTTLVEQILASHSEVHGGNELTFLNDSSTRTQTQYRLQGEFPIWLTNLPELGWAKIGKIYLDLLKTLNVNESRISDKSLMNYRAAGLIAKALPQAKMVHVVRAPMDVAFGCYRQVFGNGHLFSYDFEEIADMLSDHQKLLHHWREILPESQYRVLDYQELVKDPENQIAELLNFCDLKDEPSCYSPEKTQRTVRTLSATQVRQPINQSGINSWARYDHQLAPLKKALESRGLI
jgi:tetratricopeptide (TPR) repeat protein